MQILSQYGYTYGMLHIACEEYNPVNILQLLIDKGINPNEPDKNIQTPLHYAPVRENL